MRTYVFFRLPFIHNLIIKTFYTTRDCDSKSTFTSNKKCDNQLLLMMAALGKCIFCSSFVPCGSFFYGRIVCAQVKELASDGGTKFSCHNESDYFLFIPLEMWNTKHQPMRYHGSVIVKETGSAKFKKLYYINVNTKTVKHQTVIGSTWKVDTHWLYSHE